ncbi:hypothetical protein ABPG74_021041 [Tetrahymena malaccensis]
MQKQNKQLKNSGFSPLEQVISNTQQDIVLSPSGLPTSRQIFQQISHENNLISPLNLNSKKIEFDTSKKNSINSNLSNCFRTTQTTYFTEKNEPNDVSVKSAFQKFTSKVKTLDFSKQLSQRNKKDVKFFQMIDQGLVKLKESKSVNPQESPLLSPKQNSGMFTSRRSNSRNKIGQQKQNFALSPHQSQCEMNNQSIKFQTTNYPSQVIQQSQVSILSPRSKNLKQSSQQSRVLNKQASTTSIVSQTNQVSSVNSDQVMKKTPFTNICKKIQISMQQMQKKLRSKVQFFNHFSKLLESKSQYLQNIFLVHENKEVIQDPAVLDKALVSVINGSEYRSSTFVQRGLIKSLLLELNILNKEVFDAYLNQSKQEINNLQEKIKYERGEVEYLTSRMVAKHYPNFEKKATLFNILSHHSMPVTYNKEKYDFMEGKLGKFNLISQENRYVCSEIEKIICNLNEINYSNNNPFRNVIW